jgi:ER membrane protein complex subunit 3
MVMMQGIQHFFSGFILLKVPFPLTAGFKNMFQKGLAELPDLEPSYVSSVSWYFLVMYGLSSFFKLVIGDPSLEVREQEMLLAQLGWQTVQGPKPPDGTSMAKLLRQEAENLELFMQNHKSEMDSVEKRLLGNKRMPRKLLGSANDADFLLGTSKPKRKAQ